MRNLEDWLFDRVGDFAALSACDVSRAVHHGSFPRPNHIFFRAWQTLSDVLAYQAEQHTTLRFSHLGSVMLV